MTSCDEAEVGLIGMSERRWAQETALISLAGRSNTIGEGILEIFETRPVP